jgi:hypothetical protein
MPGLQKWMRWTEAAERFCRSGAPNLKNMSPRTRPVKTFSEKGGPQRDFRIEQITQFFRLLVPDPALLPVDFHPVFLSVA